MKFTTKHNLILLMIGLAAIGCNDHPNKTEKSIVELKEYGETGYYYEYFHPKQESLGLRTCLEI